MRNTLPKPADLGDTGTLAAKALTFHFLALLTIGVQLLVILLSAKGAGLFPETDTLMSIVATGAQIIAGLYGITLAGFTFFLSRMDALTASDHTLDYVADSVKRRFKYLIWFITLNVLVTLFVSILLMYFPVPENPNHHFFYRLFCNEFVVSLASSILLILYYSILVIDPNCLEREAVKLKKKLSRGGGPAGSAAEYITLVDQIEQQCRRLLPANVMHQLEESKDSRFSDVLELLQDSEPALYPVLRDLQRINRYYECMINCRPMSASREMCQLAGRVLQYLKQMPHST